MTTSLSSTQIGSIGETIVGAQLMIASQGRLSPFLPIADDRGVDLVVHDNVTGRSLPVQVKGRVMKAAGSAPVQFDVRLATLSERPGCFLLAVLLDMAQGSVQRAWLIPMAELRQVANEKNGVLAIVPSPSPTSNDRYTAFRCTDMAEVSQRLIAFLDASPG